ncbi:rhomboid family intramembrane serine protease [Melioribacteraceae bacterium 4301-Me]|uniref:rhomboid family intramembrane serine protease n=1 Tax=Pyranulibacter aquaticus TaxID=3163344 RepID=UPI00359B3050
MGLDSRDYYRPTGFGGFSFFPPVIKNLIIINVIVFFIQMISDNISFGGIPASVLLDRYFALNPLTGYYRYPDIPYNFQIWQLFTYQFMHGGFTHILFNMFFLWMFGMEIENLMGSRKFLIFYLLCGLGAGLVQLLLPPLFSDTLAPTIGASGAVFGVMIAFGMFFPDRYIYIYFLIPVKAKYLIAFLVVIEFMSVGNQSLIAHFAHIGGALTGFLLVMLDRSNNFNVNWLFNKFRGHRGEIKTPFRTRKRSIYDDDEIQEAKFYDIDDKNDEIITQEEIDRILDKISQSGYQNLTEREKRILFEASKRK